MKRVLSMMLVLALVVGLHPLSLKAAQVSNECRVLELHEMERIIGTGRPGGSTSDDSDQSYNYEWRKKVDHRTDFGTATMVFYEENRTRNDIRIEQKVIDSWYIEASLSASAKVKSVFNLSGQWVGKRYHEEVTKRNMVISSGHYLKIYTKPYTETTTYRYQQWKVYSGSKRDEMISEEVGTYTSYSKKVTYVEHPVR